MVTDVMPLGTAGLTRAAGTGGVWGPAFTVPWGQGVSPDCSHLETGPGQVAEWCLAMLGRVERRALYSRYDVRKHQCPPYTRGPPSTPVSSCHDGKSTVALMPQLPPFSGQMWPHLGPKAQEAREGQRPGAGERSCAATAMGAVSRTAPLCRAPCLPPARGCLRAYLSSLF